MALAKERSEQFESGEFPSYKEVGRRYPREVHERDEAAIARIRALKDKRQEKDK